MRTRTVVTLVTLTVLMVAVPTASMAQHHRGGGSGGQSTAPSGGGRGSDGGGTGGSSGAGSSGGSSGGGQQAVPRGGGGDNPGAQGGTATNAPPPESRPRDDHSPHAGAVERSARPGPNGGPTTVIVTGGGYYPGFFPWGYGGLGVIGYYGGYDDPWLYDAPGAYGYDLPYTGAIRLKVKPRDGSVYVDGYFAGLVDEFDGVFQKLSIESGPHRLEIRADGYEPLEFDVRIQPDRTITYSGNLRKR